MNPSAKLIYLCDRCEKSIGGTKLDPVTWTSLGRMHYHCMQLAFHDKANRRSEAQKLRRQRENAVPAASVVALPETV